MNDTLNNDIKTLQNIIDESDNIVFFGGAGVSTESGIPDFRSKKGLYNQKYKYNPEEIISHHFFNENINEFYRFYKDRMIDLNAKPNAAHLFLSELEKAGKLKALITQNIDTLHQKAGNKNVLCLHGSIQHNYCQKCKKDYSPEFIKNDQADVPTCSCGGIIKPDVVLYEEPLDENVVTSAIKYISQADVLIVAGTSLVVYPAASFIRYFQGRKLVLINKDKTNANQFADVVIHQKIGELFSKLHV